MVIIRKNVKTGEYERYISDGNYWSPGIQGNDSVRIRPVYEDNTTIRNAINTILSYETDDNVYPNNTYNISIGMVNLFEFNRIITSEFDEF